MTNYDLRITNRATCAAARRFCFSLIAVLPLFLGCQAMYFLTTQETKTQKAEYSKIGQRPLAVIVWADRPTLDADPRARRRVCDAVLYHMKKNLPVISSKPRRWRIFSRAPVSTGRA
jgi:hypothetical protein